MNRVTFTKFVAVPLASLAVLSVGAAIQGQTAPPKSASKAKASAKVLLDLNKATVDELEEQLSGVGPATAKKIVAGRPYSSVDDLAKAGVSQACYRWDPRPGVGGCCSRPPSPNPPPRRTRSPKPTTSRKPRQVR